MLGYSKNWNDVLNRPHDEAVRWRKENGVSSEAAKAPEAPEAEPKKIDFSSN